MTTMSKLRIALFGAGLIGREHAKLLQASDKLELAVVADPSEDARQFAQALGVEWRANYEDVLQTMALDGVIVALPNQLHLASGLACLRRGLPTLMEKPVADTVVDAMALSRAQRETDVPMLVGHHRRHSPDIQAARAAVEAGSIGTLVAVNGFWWTRKHDSYFEMAWRRQAGGGPLWINLIHEIDCLRFICGEIEAVQAISSNRQRGFAVEDTCAIILRFSNGALGTFTLSDSVASPYIWDITSGQALYFPSQPEDCYYFGGTAGSLAVPTMNLWTYENDGDWRSQPVRRHLRVANGSCYENQLANFEAVIRREQAPVVSAHDGAMTVAVIAAIEQAARHHSTVTVADVLREAA